MGHQAEGGGKQVAGQASGSARKRLFAFCAFVVPSHLEDVGTPLKIRQAEFDFAVKAARPQQCLA